MRYRRIKNDKSMIAVGYIRVSTEGQVESGLGLHDQKRKIKSYCKLKGYKLEAILADEGVSAAKIPMRARVMGSKLCEMIGRGEVGAVVSLRLDRLFRRTVDALNTTDQWNKSGVSLHLVDFGGNAVDTSTAMGQMFLTMMAGFAQFESSLISERTKAALDVMKLQGKKTGVLPYGYRDAATGYIEEDPVEYPILQRILSMRRSGAGIAKIQRFLNGRRIPCKSGKPWHYMTLYKMMVRYQKIGEVP